MTAAFQRDRIDRIAPTLQPPGRAVLHQRWAELLFLHWTVPAEMLRPLIPPALEIDTFEGRAYVGLVPFTMTGIRPLWSPSFPPLSDFHETNVRTYVHFQGRDPGVWFFSLDAANALAVRLARVWFKLPYYFARMRLELPADRDRDPALRGDSEREAAYSCTRYRAERLWPEPTPAQCAVDYFPTGEVCPAQVGTREHFLAERYILYTQSVGRLYSGRVHHAPYPLQTAQVVHLEENLLAAAGLRRPEEPPLAHYAREVRVLVYPLQRVL